jgi:hypothetical protein
MSYEEFHSYLEITNESLAYINNDISRQINDLVYSALESGLADIKEKINAESVKAFFKMVIEKLKELWQAFLNFFKEVINIFKKKNVKDSDIYEEEELTIDQIRENVAKARDMLNMSTNETDLGGSIEPTPQTGFMNTNVNESSGYSTFNGKTGEDFYADNFANNVYKEAATGMKITVTKELKLIIKDTAKILNRLYGNVIHDKKKNTYYISGKSLKIALAEVANVNKRVDKELRVVDKLLNKTEDTVFIRLIRVQFVTILNELSTISNLINIMSEKKVYNAA